MSTNQPNAYTGIYEEPITRRDNFRVTDPWYDALNRLTARANDSVQGSGANGQIAYWDGTKSITGDNNLRWEAVDHTQTIEPSATESALRIDPVSVATFGLDDYVELDFGQHVTGGTNISEAVNPAQIWWDDTGGLHFEIDQGNTAGNPVSFTEIAGLSVLTQEVHAFQANGTGAVPGATIGATRNTAGGGAASSLSGQLKDGRFFIFWVDGTGAPRWNVGATLAAIRPTENGSVSDTSGNLFGSGTGTTTITNLFTRRGDDGRTGVPGLPGPPGATGATGATGPAGAAGIIVGRRPDEGRMGVPGPQGATGATGTSGTGTLIGVQTITTTGAGTYTPTLGTASVIIELQGAGGGGGGAVGTPGVNNGAAGQGGGGGGWLRVRLTTAFSGASYSVGAKGTGGTAGNNPGTGGGNTTFTATGGGGTVYTAGGGTAGGGGGAAAFLNAGAVVAGGTCTNGDQQQPGGASYGALIATANNVLGSVGGISHYSSGGQPVRFNAANSTQNGNAATGKGGGGSGGANVGSGAAASGGDGTDGVIIIWEYA